MNIDVSTTMKVILAIIAIVIVISLVMAVRSIKAGHKLMFYQKRQMLVYRGWRLILFSILLVGVGFVLSRLVNPWFTGIFHRRQRLLLLQQSPRLPRLHSLHR